MVDEQGNVVINSPETVKALEYAKQLYETFVPGTLSWLDPNNNKAFLDGQVSITNNGISIYYAAKNSQDAKIKEMARDIGHANYPIGPVGRPTELHLFSQAMVFRYTKSPNAAKDLVRVHMEKEQYEPWQQAAIGYVTQPLKAYESNQIWTVDPKHTPYRDCVAKMTPHSYAGRWATRPPRRWPTTSWSTWWPRRRAGRRRRRKRPSARRSAPSVTTKSEG